MYNELSNSFISISDPRDNNSKHKLIDILTIATCAIICGADTWTDIAQYGTSKQEWFSTFLELNHGIPSHDTFGRVFSIINPKEFQEAFIKWIKDISDKVTGDVIAIDGKTVRHSFDTSNNKSSIHMVSAWSNQLGLVLGQIKVNDKSNEITAIPELLDKIDINKSIVTIDAMGTQKNIAKKIIKKGGDYVLALKGNHKNFSNDIKYFFEEESKNKFADVEYSFFKTTNKDHGRIETRKHYLINDLNWLSQKSEWKNLNSIIMVESERTIGDKTSKERRYYISSLTENVEKVADAIRKHWGIENSLHWILDIAFREDDSRIRIENASENFAILRHIALNLLKNEKSVKIGVKAKRLKSGWDNDYLKKVLTSIQ